MKTKQQKSKKNKYYLYYTCVDNLKSIPSDEFKDQLKIVYNKNNTIIFCVLGDEEEEKVNEN